MKEREIEPQMEPKEGDLRRIKEVEQVFLEAFQSPDLNQAIELLVSVMEVPTRQIFKAIRYDQSSGKPTKLRWENVIERRNRDSMHITIRNDGNERFERESEIPFVSHDDALCENFRSLIRKHYGNNSGAQFLWRDILIKYDGFDGNIYLNRLHRIN